MTWLSGNKVDENLVPQLSDRTDLSGDLLQHINDHFEGDFQIEINGLMEQISHDLA